MLTTGIKQLIVNNAVDITTYATLDAELKIKGLPVIDVNNILKLSIEEPHDAVPGQYGYAIAATTAISAGEEFVAVFQVKSYRNQGNFFGNRYNNSDQLALQCTAVAGNAAGIVDGIENAFNALSAEDKERYFLSAITNTGGTNFTITMTEWSVYLDLLKIDDAVGSSVNLTITRTVVIKPFEGRGLPKYLREVVAANTFANTSAYGMKNENQLNDNTRYTLLSMDVYVNSIVGNSGVINGSPAAKTVKYEVWIDEDIDLTVATGAKIVTNGATATSMFDDAAPSGGAAGGSQAATDTQHEQYADGTIGKIFVYEAWK